MSNVTNDQRILELKKQIALKKEQLNKSQRFAPITNCSISLEGERYNLNALSKDALIDIMVKVNALFMSSKDLGVSEDYLISGFKPEEWITDIKAKIEILSRRDEEKALKAMEDKLTKLLSEDKKVELELNEIESFLK